MGKILLQCIHTSNLHIVYFKYLTTLFVNYTSIKLKKDKTNNEILLHQLPVDSHLTESKSQRLYRKSSTGKCSLTFLYLSNHTYHSLPNHMASLPGKHPLHGVCTTSFLSFFSQISGGLISLSLLQVFTQMTP